MLSKALIHDNWRFVRPELAYFDHHGDEQKGEYNHYKLGVGEEDTFTIGIFLTDIVKLSDGLILHIGADLHSQTYVDLELP